MFRRLNRDDDSSSSVDRDESFLEKNQESVADVLFQGEECLFEDIPREADEPAVGKISINKQGCIVVVAQHIHYQF